MHEKSLKKGSYFYITNRNNNVQQEMALTFHADADNA